jgi:hypothetical protein
VGDRATADAETKDEQNQGDEASADADRYFFYVGELLCHNYPSAVPRQV